MARIYFHDREPCSAGLEILHLDKTNDLFQQKEKHQHHIQGHTIGRLEGWVIGSGRRSTVGKALGEIDGSDRRSASIPIDSIENNHSRHFLFHLLAAVVTFLRYCKHRIPLTVSSQCLVLTARQGVSRSIRCRMWLDEGRDQHCRHLRCKEPLGSFSGVSSHIRKRANTIYGKTPERRDCLHTGLKQRAGAGGL
jgi:hypothetical protein